MTPAALSTAVARRTPLVIGPFRTFPPIASTTPRNDLIRSHRSILGGVPLRGNCWVAGNQTIGNRHLLLAAEGTLLWTLGAFLERGGPFVVHPTGTFPPHALVATPHQGLGFKRPIPSRMPLLQQLREMKRETIGHRHPQTTTEGASAARHPLDRARLPFMIRAPGAFPPMLL